MRAVEMCHEHSVKSIVSCQAPNSPTQTVQPKKSKPKSTIFSRVMSAAQDSTAFKNIGICWMSHRHGQCSLLVLDFVLRMKDIMDAGNRAWMMSVGSRE